jgi:hypothetical protein
LQEVSHRSLAGAGQEGYDRALEKEPRMRASLAVFALLLGSAPVAAPAQADKPAPADGPKAQQAAAAAPRAPRASDVDARHCLEHKSNRDVHRCAERYRPKRS